MVRNNVYALYDGERNLWDGTVGEIADGFTI